MSNKRFVYVLLAAVLMLFSLAGCRDGPSKEAVLNQLKADHNEQYALHLFYENVLPSSETSELNRFHNSDQRITNALIRVQFWDQQQERNREWAKAIGVKTFPTYVILDAKGILFETPYLSRVKEFLSEQLLHE